MIIIKQIAFGNSSEAYIQSGFTNGLNIISSSENHVGKTLIMQAMMYALGSVPMFPASFPAEDYVFLIDLGIDGNRSLSILRSGNTFIIKEGDTVTPIESVMILIVIGATIFLNFLELSKMTKCILSRLIYLSKWLLCLRLSVILHEFMEGVTKKMISWK